jgi:lipooligosaccharide transport system permease protein
MIGALRMVQRNALVYRHMWRGSLFSSFLQPTLFLIAIGVGLGTMIDPRAAALPGGVSYVEFLAPGLLAAAAMQVAAFESTYPVLDKMTWHYNYHAIAATPMRTWDLVVGELTWMAVRLTTIATAFVLVMTAFGVPRSLWVILAIPATVLTGLAFAAPIMAFAATRKTSGTFNVLYRFGVTPLFLFSGVFVPVARLPEWIQWIASITPLFHGVELVRSLTLDMAARQWVLHAAVLLAFIAIGIAFALRTFERRLRA